MHPTRMHSCFVFFFVLVTKIGNTVDLAIDGVHISIFFNYLNGYAWEIHFLGFF